MAKYGVHILLPSHKLEGARCARADACTLYSTKTPLNTLYSTKTPLNTLKNTKTLKNTWKNTKTLKNTVKMARVAGVGEAEAAARAVHHRGDVPHRQDSVRLVRRRRGARAP